MSLIPEMEWVTLLPCSANQNSLKPLALEDFSFYFSVAGKFPWSPLQSSLLFKRKKELFFPEQSGIPKTFPEKWKFTLQFNVLQFLLHERKYHRLLE